MRVLALDASGPTGAIAVTEGEKALFSATFDSPRGRGGQLFPLLAEALALSPGRIAVGTGPGSYNGIRSAIAAAWGAHIATGIPVVPACSLLAVGGGCREFIAVGDARGDSFYYAHIDGGFLADGPRLVDRETLAALLDHTPHTPVFCPSPLDIAPRAIVSEADAVRLTTISLGLPVAAETPEPLYLKPPHITTPRLSR